MTPREQKLIDALQLLLRTERRMNSVNQGVLTVTRNVDRLALSTQIDGMSESLKQIREMVKDLLKEEQATHRVLLTGLLAKYPRPWRYLEDHEGAGFGDVYAGDDANVARLMWEDDAEDLIAYANQQPN